jgi:hypothetical protein
VLLADPAYHDTPWLILGSCWDLQQVHIMPQGLRLNKVDPMLYLVGLAFVIIEFEFHGIKSIPFWHYLSTHYSLNDGLTVYTGLPVGKGETPTKLAWGGGSAAAHPCMP